MFWRTLLKRLQVLLSSRIIFNYLIDAHSIWNISRDIGGVWTIGYGNTRWEDGRAVASGDTCTKARCDSLFNYWVDESFAPAVDADIGTPSPDVNQVQFEALVSFTYNVGTSAFHTSTLLKKVQANPNDPTIRDEFMKWVGCAYILLFSIISKELIKPQIISINF